MSCNKGEEEFNSRWFLMTREGGEGKAKSDFSWQRGAGVKWGYIKDKLQRKNKAIIGLNLISLFPQDDVCYIVIQNEVD